MGGRKSKLEPSYIYTSTCASPTTGQACMKTYTVYQSDGNDLQVTKYVAPAVCYGVNVEDRIAHPPYVAAMVIKHPDLPSNTSMFEAECLDEHNLARGRHGIGPLALNRKMCKYANQAAEELAANNSTERRDGSKYGENIYVACGADINGRDPVRAWYSEICKYSFVNGRFSYETGHFTQLIWKNSKNLGVGLAMSSDSTYVICCYDPPGNYSNEFRENVLPPL